MVVDDVALELGVVRVRERGSHGGHNGLRSIAEALGTSDFARVRVGVRDPGQGVDALPGDLAEYVLAEFPAEHAAPLRCRAVALAADAAECLAARGRRGGDEPLQRPPRLSYTRRLSRPWRPRRSYPCSR